MKDRITAKQFQPIELLFNKYNEHLKEVRNWNLEKTVLKLKNIDKRNEYSDIEVCTGRHL